MKTLDEKLRSIHADPNGSPEFIIADAKDADMAFGMGAPGLSPEKHAPHPRFKTLAQYRQQIRDVVQQGIVDIMLMSASTNELLTIQELVATGHGISLVPAMARDIDRGKGCQYRRLEAPVPTRTLRMVWHKARYQSPLASEFITMMRAMGEKRAR